MLSRSGLSLGRGRSPAALRARVGLVALWSESSLSLLLFFLTLLTRLPFHSQMLFNWDAANFAFALNVFDVTRHFPHPPGYPYFVALGRLLNLFQLQANASLTLEAALFSALAVVALYLLGRAIYDAATGFTAALLLLGSVTFWSYGGFALAYTSLAFFSTLSALLAYRILIQRKRGLLLALTLVYSVAQGFRPDLLLFLAPLWLACWWRAGWGLKGVTLPLALLGFLLWFGPTVWLSGGLNEYWAVLSQYLARDVVERYSVLDGGWAALLRNLRDLILYLFYALYIYALPLLWGALWLLRKPSLLWSREGLLAILWGAPLLLFYLLVHIGDPGYVFTLLPLLLLLLARILLSYPFPFLSERWPRATPALLLVLLLSVNAGVFFFHPRLLTLPGIRANDLSLRERITYIEHNLSPESSLLLSYESYRQFQYYLPQYRGFWLDIVSLSEAEVAIPRGSTTIVLLDPSLQVLNRSRSVTEEVLLKGGVKLHLLRVTPTQRLLYERHGLRLEDSASSPASYQSPDPLPQIQEPRLDSPELLLQPTPEPRKSPPSPLRRVIITRGDPSLPLVALTFDAGSGTGSTQRVLDILSENGVPATFFVTGRWAQANPSLLREVVAHGHEVGNHSYSHPDLTQLPDAEVVAQVEKTEAIIRETAGTSSMPYFRPPFGAYNARLLQLLEGLGYQGIYWTLDSTDWRPESTSLQIRSRVLGGANNGAIIVFHSAEPKTAEALPAIIQGLREKGYALVTLSSLLAQGPR